MTQEHQPIEGIDPEQQIIEQSGPFGVLERRILYEGFNRQLYVDRVRGPDGTLGEFSGVNFLRQAVLIFPVDNERNIYLTDEFTYGSKMYLTEAAGGSIDPDESAEAAAKREVKEELGIEVDLVRYLATVRTITSVTNNVTHLFLARVQSVGEAKPESGEVIRLKKVPFDEAYQMTLDGRISTASVIVGIDRIRDLYLATQGNLESN